MTGAGHTKVRGLCLRGSYSGQAGTSDAQTCPAEEPSEGTEGSQKRQKEKGIGRERGERREERGRGEGDRRGGPRNRPYRYPLYQLDLPEWKRKGEAGHLSSSTGMWSSFAAGKTSREVNMRTALVFVFLLSGCAASTKHVRMSQIIYAPVSWCEILLEVPERPYTVIAIIETDGDFDEYTDMLERIRDKGRKIGAHAVIVTPLEDKGNQSRRRVPIARSIDRDAMMKAVAIRWKNTESKYDK